jgi:hypothetical protein
MSPPLPRKVVVVPTRPRSGSHRSISAPNSSLQIGVAKPSLPLRCLRRFFPRPLRSDAAQPLMTAPHCGAVHGDATAAMIMGVTMTPDILSLGHGSLGWPKTQFDSSGLENTIPYIESICRMPSWTEVCEAALGRSQQALSGVVVTCISVVVSWKRNAAFNANRSMQ